MHTIWKGAICFGLVSIPVKMYSATEEKDISLKSIHRECGTPINYEKACKRCSKKVDNDEIIQGYEFDNGKVVLFEKDELDRLLPDKNKEIRILDFIDAKDIDPIYFQKTYYLGPGETYDNAYMLLLQAMQRKKKIGITKVIIRNKTSLAAIRVLPGNCFALEPIYYANEVRPVDQVPNLPTDSKIKTNELQMAEMLIEQLSGPFHPEKYQDDYRVQLMELIHKKAAGQEAAYVVEQPAKAVLDLNLAEALQASIDAVQAANDLKAKKTKKKEKAV